MCYKQYVRIFFFSHIFGHLTTKSVLTSLGRSSMRSTAIWSGASFPWTRPPHLPRLPSSLVSKPYNLYWPRLGRSKVFQISQIIFYQWWKGTYIVRDIWILCELRHPKYWQQITLLTFSNEQTKASINWTHNKGNSSNTDNMPYFCDPDNTRVVNLAISSLEPPIPLNPSPSTSPKFWNPSTL